VTTGITFTFGGLKITNNAEVEDASGRPIARRPLLPQLRQRHRPHVRRRLRPHRRAERCAREGVTARHPGTDPSAARAVVQTAIRARGKKRSGSSY